jgi:hypothetical protein
MRARYRACKCRSFAWSATDRHHDCRLRRRRPRADAVRSGGVVCGERRFPSGSIACAPAGGRRPRVQT